MARVSTAQIGDLKESISGDVLLPGDERFYEARRIWNGMIDKHPAVIVQCLNTGDVVRAVNTAQENGLLIAVKGGGHNIAGNAICDDGMVIDLSRMKAVTVSARTQLASVEGGATLADLDAATQAHGLATPLGINSTTGVAGLTLGGGFGWLSRRFGMTVDNLESAEVVTADGAIVRASASEHPELFWALCGGGGNFGVVTTFQFRLHAVGPDVLSGLIVFPLTEARSVLRKYRDFAASAPDELSVWTILRSAPPLPFLPASAHGTGMVALAIFYAGDPATGEALIAPLRNFGTPLGEHVGVQPYVNWQQGFDPLLTPGARNYWKSHNFTSLDDGLLDVVIAAAGQLPSPECEVFFAALGGETSRRAPDATAYTNRDAQFVMNVHGRWQDPKDDGRCIKWARDLFAAAGQYASGGVYVNFLTADEGDRVRSAYGSNYDRL
ncbi:MAG: FAD-binding protein, partial [Gemmatimonadaceae bacterium]